MTNRDMDGTKAKSGGCCSGGTCSKNANNKAKPKPQPVVETEIDTPKQTMDPIKDSSIDKNVQSNDNNAKDDGSNSNSNSNGSVKKGGCCSNGTCKKNSKSSPVSAPAAMNTKSNDVNANSIDVNIDVNIDAAIDSNAVKVSLVGNIDKGSQEPEDSCKSKTVSNSDGKEKKGCCSSGGCSKKKKEETEKEKDDKQESGNSKVKADGNAKGCCAGASKQNKPPCEEKPKPSSCKKSCCDSKKKSIEIATPATSPTIEPEANQCCAREIQEAKECCSPKDKVLHDKPDCLAIIRENGLIDVYDRMGQVKTFVAGDATKEGKVCFSAHGHDVGEFLTPCFDQHGLHGEPEEGCFCGIDTPHLHAHMHDDLKCRDDKNYANINKLAMLTYHPVEENEEQSRERSMSLSDIFPAKCNSKEVKKSLTEGGVCVSEYSRSRENIFKVQHEDHYDLLVHNAKTGNLTLEHDCKSCGDTDVHGALNLVSKRSWMGNDSYFSKNGKGENCAAANGNNSSGIKMNFYEIPKAPLKILDLLSDFFEMEEDRVTILRNAFPQSNSPSRRKVKVSDCCSSGKCTQPHRMKCCANPQMANNAATNKGNAAAAVADSSGSGEVRSTIHVKQICCAAEIPMVKSIIEPLPGIVKVSISTTTKLVHVNHIPAVTTAGQITEALNKERFGATLKKDGGLVKMSGNLALSSASTSTSGKSSFFVTGICCAAEIPAINAILEPIQGVQKVAINVPNKTVYVNHEFALVSASDIKAALDAEKFDCSISKDAGAALSKPTVMSKYVESTFLINSLFDVSTADKMKHVLREKYNKNQLSHSETHVPSNTVKIDHNPQLVSASTLINFLKKSGFDVSLVVDGFAEGIWSSGEEDEVEEHKVKLQWNVVMSGFFWIFSMFHLIDTESNWDYLKYTALISVVLGIPKIAMKAFLTLKRGQFDTNCMMLFAAVGAVALQEYSEAAAVTFLFSISDWLESLSTARARNALSAIVRLRPERAKVMDPISGKFVVVPASEVPVGSIVSVRTGDKIPCDGKVEEGRSTVDESSLTGESRPVQKIPGDDVSGGTINAGLAQLLIKTTSNADDSAVARLIRLVEDAQANRSPTEKMIDEFAKRYTPVVVLLAISMCTFPWIAGPDTGREWTKIGLVTIVIACPCALIISTPVTYVAGLAAAAQRGIVVKGGAHLESLGRVRKIAFDKTGTLTEGNFKLLHLRTWDKITRKEAFQYLYAMEAHASHPLATAMVSAAKAENVEVPSEWKIESHQNLEGEGVRATVDGRTVHVGNFRLFERLSLIGELPREESEIARNWMHDGSTVGFMSIEGFGIVSSYCVADAVRGEAKDVISSFRNLGIDVNMLTGDNSKAATSIGRGLGLADGQIKSNLLPDEKLYLVKKMIETQKDAVSGSFLCGRKPDLILMCGDGVNDAPALALADVGVAMGAGAALAMETADVTLLDSNLNKLLKVVKLGRRVTRTIIENVVFSFVAKAVVMSFTFAGYSSLWAAIGSDVGAMLIVTANGMKLLPSKKSVRSGSGFDTFEVTGAKKSAVKREEVDVVFPIRVPKKADEEM